MKNLLEQLGIKLPASGTFYGSSSNPTSKKSVKFCSTSPINGQILGEIIEPSDGDYESVLTSATENFIRWSAYPAPKRGEVVREIASELRTHQAALGELISWEVGKIRAEGVGEIQEAIDIADFAVGLARQLQGSTLPSERPQHRLTETWHPLGSVAVITAFNFPAAVWAWNSMIGAVCGNSIIWKPSEQTPLTAVAMTKICSDVAARHGFPALFTLLAGGDTSIGEKLAADSRIALVSATGSARMGRSVGESVSRRLGRSLLELGGNNGAIVLHDANLELALRAVVFGAVGTAGQRCTTTRRVIIEKTIQQVFTERLLAAYQQIKIGDPLEPGVLMGPLINAAAVTAYSKALERIRAEGGTILYGGKVLSGLPSPLYVEPTIVLAKKDMPILREETFAPILYVIPVENLSEAILVNNSVPQGLSSAIFTENLRAAEQFLSHAGSDCGLANVNCGTSGAEIGAAFGGEKESGGGREAGSDSWKAYMRRQTSTINWGTTIPLAQGIRFDF